MQILLQIFIAVLDSHFLATMAQLANDSPLTRRCLDGTGSTPGGVCHSKQSPVLYYKLCCSVSNSEHHRLIYTSPILMQRFSRNSFLQVFNIRHECHDELAKFALLLIRPTNTIFQSPITL